MLMFKQRMTPNKTAFAINKNRINPLFSIFAIGLLIFSALTLKPANSFASENGKEILYWVGPMDASYRRDKPGKSPMGMALIPVYAGTDDGSDVTISPAVVQNLGIRTARAELGKLWRGIDTVGYVDYDESLVSHIHMRTSGWIENLSVYSEGERVKKGDRLFDLYSPELVNAQEELVTALSSGNKGLIRASKERLSALGVGDNQIKALQKNKKALQLISIYAPQDGVVSTLPVREGMYIKPSTKIMTLGDLSSVWVLAEVFERQTNWVQTGQDAEVKMSFIPGKRWEGKVQYIYPSLDPKTRTLKVRLRFDNPGERLKPNMYANVKIYGAAKTNIIIIPTEGLIRTGRNEHVIIALGEGKFAAREVVSGIESGDYIEIKSGVKDGEKIVTSGQFLIDSEASMRASFNRMSEGDSDNTEMKSDMNMDAEPQVVSSIGIVKAIMTDSRKLSLKHDPIPALGWPAMTMSFSLSDDVDINNISVDEAVIFDLQERDNKYFIIALKKAGDVIKTDSNKDMKGMENMQ